MSTRLGIVAGITAIAACVVPTDRGADITVVVEADEIQLLLGERTTLAPVADGSDGPAGNVTFAFVSSDPAVAQVDAAGTVLGAGVGDAAIVVTARTFASASPDTVVVHVIDNVRFDAVTPTSVRFGDTVTITGAALDPVHLVVVAVGGFPAPVASFRGAAAGVPNARDTLRVIVPVGAARASDLVALHERGASAFVPLTVEQHDRLEPNDSTPARIGDPFAFASTQLALESGAGRPVDWYRLGTIDRSATLELRLGVVRQFGLVAVTLMSPIAQRGDIPQWSARAMTLPWNSQRGSYGGAPSVSCRGLSATYDRVTVFFNRDFSQEVVRIPLLDAALDSVDLVVELLGETDVPWPYQVRIVPGYVADFPADAYEENDWCDVAPVIEAGVHELTLDHHFDMDWFRLVVPTGSHRLSIGADYRSDGTAIVDVDMMLYRDTTAGVPATPDQLPIIATAATAAPSFGPNTPAIERMETTVPAGNYLLLVRNAYAYAVNRVDLSIVLTPAP